MTEPAPPARSAGPHAGPPDASPAARGRELRRPGGDADGLVMAIDVLLLRIDVVWNETPETLAMLAEWADTLQAQRLDLLEWHADGRRSRGRQWFRRADRKAALDLGLLLHLGRRLSQLAVLGERLRLAQADGAARSDDPAYRAMLERHHARTGSHLARLHERLHPGH